jgi:hypothetical protein
MSPKKVTKHGGFESIYITKVKPPKHENCGKNDMLSGQMNIKEEVSND